MQTDTLPDTLLSEALEADNTVLGILAPGVRHKRIEHAKKPKNPIDSDFVVDLPAVFQTDAVVNSAVYRQSWALKQSILHQQDVEDESLLRERSKRAERLLSLNQFRPQQHPLSEADATSQGLLSREKEFYFVKLVEEPSPDLWCSALVPSNYEALYASVSHHFLSFVHECVSSSSMSAVSLALEFVKHLVRNRMEILCDAEGLFEVLNSLTIAPNFSTLSHSAGAYIPYMALPNGTLALKKLELVFTCFRLVPQQPSLICYFMLVLADTNLYQHHQADLADFSSSVYALFKTIDFPTLITRVQFFAGFSVSAGGDEFAATSVRSQLHFRALNTLWNLWDRSIVQKMIHRFAGGPIACEGTVADCVDVAFAINLNLPPASVRRVTEAHFQIYALLLVLSPFHTIRGDQATDMRIIDMLESKQRQLESLLSALLGSDDELLRKCGSRATALMLKIMVLKRQYQRRTVVDMFYDT